MRKSSRMLAAAVAAVLSVAGCGSSSSSSNSSSLVSSSSLGNSGSSGSVPSGSDVQRAADPSASGPSTAGAPIGVVASTDVWGDVVTQIGGDRVDVVSIITDPEADPHSYEANAQAQLAISKAAILVENGGGYDDFVDTMRAAADSKAVLINAVQLSGKTAAAGSELNEHVWYDFPTVATVADSLVAELSALDPASAAEFKANGEEFKTKLTTLEAAEAAIKSAHQGAGVAITEPVPLYLLQAAGLDNLTPEEFSEAVEEGTDVPAPVLNETLALFTDKKVSALVYNEQTSDAQTEQLLAAAKTSGIAVVPVTETLPAGQDYISWMTANVQAVAAALGS